MMRKDKQSEDKLEKTKRILEYIPLMFFTILAVIAVSFVFFQEIVSDIFGNIYLQICIVAALLTFVCTIMIWRITRITQKEEREKIDIWVNDKNKAIMQKVDEFSIECVKGLVSNQKRLFGPYIDEIDKIKQKDIIKTLDFLNAIKRY